jgi:hypothetical protein
LQRAVAGLSLRHGVLEAENFSRDRTPSTAVERIEATELEGLIAEAKGMDAKQQDLRGPSFLDVPPAPRVY